MKVDVFSLKEFYASRLGHIASRLMRDYIKECWPELGNDTLLGIGYTQPILPIWKRSKRSESHVPSDCYALMPDTLGAVYWPTRGKNKTGMVSVNQLPVRDQQCNRILLLHALEHAEPTSELLLECWRILVPGGRMLVCVPNRHSMWSRKERSPFSTGRPYSISEIKQLLLDHQFTLSRIDSALHTPPFAWRWLIKLMPWIEQAGRAFFPMFGGLLVVEVEKQLYASIKEKRPTLNPVRALMPSKASALSGNQRQ